jgi:endonuclease IV
MSKHDLQEVVYKEAFTKDFDERSDSEKVVVWQQHTINELKDQIKTLQENNLINVDQGIYVESMQVVRQMVELAEVSETADEYIHLQMVVNFSHVNM